MTVASRGKCCAGAKLHLHGAAVLYAPVVERLERGRKIAAAGCQCITFLPTGVRFQANETRIHQLAQPLGQHLFRQRWDRAAQFGISQRALLEPCKDNGLPLAPEHIERELNGAAIHSSTLVHDKGRPTMMSSKPRPNSLPARLSWIASSILVTRNTL